ncbi:hypothetical protein GQ457_16G009810 [Hibiscus cannabinus]
MEQWWYLGFSVFIALVWASLGKWSNPKCKGTLPPGSMGFPLIGETFSLILTSNSIDVHPFFTQRIKRYGSLFKTSIAGRAVVVSSDPDFNHFVLQQEEKLVEFYYMDSLAKLVHYDNMNNMGGYFHRYIRRVVLAHFGHEPLKQNLSSEFEVVINRELLEWTKLPLVDLKHQTDPMLFNIASKVLIGCVLKENLGHDLSNFLEGLMTFPLYFPGTTFYKCLKKKNRALKLLREVVEERMKSNSNSNSNGAAEDCSKNGDFLERIMGDIGKEAFSTKQFVSYFLFGLLIASTETISATITLAAKFLLDNPSALQQLTEEHERILKDREDAEAGLSWAEYKSMTFTQYVIDETLRLMNLLPGMLRRTITDIHVNGYTIPKGWILMAIPTVHLDPNIYEDPLTFNPSRWKNMGANTKAKNFMPFGGGNRACAGSEFSRVVVAVFLHIWVSKYRFTKIKGGDVARAPLLLFKNGFHVKVSEK